MPLPDVYMREVLVQLADTLVADFDMTDFLDTLTKRCVQLLDVTACGLLLVDRHNTLTMIAASNEDTRLLELLQLQNSEGPCLDCYSSGTSVTCPDLNFAHDRWPRFAHAAREAGFTAVHTLPMRLRDEIVGAVDLFSAAPGSLDEQSLQLGQALADAATIGILHKRIVHRHERAAQQLQVALNSRILIEQAKGVLAERLRVPIEEAFTALRAHARDTNSKLLDVASSVVDNTLAIELPHSADRRGPQHRAAFRRAGG